MTAGIAIGAPWGDEGKGKIVDRLAADASVVIRHQGGASAGHTIYAEGRKVVLHLVPSGTPRAGRAAIIGDGAQSAMLDHGTWPCVTSSNTIGGASTGACVWVDFTARVGASVSTGPGQEHTFSHSDIW